MTNKKQTEYVNGFYLKRWPTAPDYVLCSGDIGREVLIKYLESKTDKYIKIKIVKGRDNEKGQKTAQVVIDDFVPNRDYKKDISEEFKKPVAAVEVPDMEYGDIDYGDIIDPNDIPF